VEKLGDDIHTLSLAYFTDEAWFLEILRIIAYGQRKIPTSRIKLPHILTGVWCAVTQWKIWDTSQMQKSQRRYDTVHELHRHITERKTA